MTLHFSKRLGNKGCAGDDRPPRWAEALLMRLLKPNEREAISGDLLEEYREERLPAMGRVRAGFWYLRQVISIASVQRFQGGPMKSLLLCLCFFSLAATAWLGIMETILHHPGFILRIFVAFLLAAQSLTTIVFLILRGRGGMKILVALGGGLITIFGVSAIVSILRAAHFEGYVLVIGCALVLQGALTIFVVTFIGDRRLRPRNIDIG
jgi:hypothetical protein